MARLCIIKNIDSAHGKHIHGHTFRIEINFKDKLINNMVGNIDFHEINPKIDSVISKLDKTYIDDVIKTRATIENIAIYFSNNDPYVSQSEAEKFASSILAENVLINEAGHFNEKYGYIEFTKLLEYI